jgi:TetR/AcrR family transcriptional repressor of nem operon
MGETKTAQAILDKAQALCQARGFNAFSYKDIAESLGIQKASIHYHYPTKVDLGAALIERYAQGFALELARIEASYKEPKKQLREFVKLMEQLKHDGRLCLCAMLASDLETLDPRLCQLVRDFFKAAESWIEGRLTAGKKAGQFSFTKPARVVAQVFLASIQGILICARTFEGGEDRFEAGRDWLFDAIEA